MIDLYSIGTPNGQKITIALEEMGIPYTAHVVDFRKGEQFNPNFLKISPNNKIPAIVDQENGLSLFESGAILQYLADKTGKLIPPRNSIEYYQVIQWLSWQIAGLGPMTGQVGFFFKYCTHDVPVGKERYLNETKRLWSVLEKHLADGNKHFVVGNDLTIADVAIFPWLRAYKFYSNEHVTEALSLEKHPHIKGYIERIEQRPAVQKGLVVTPFP